MTLVAATTEEDERHALVRFTVPPTRPYLLDSNGTSSFRSSSAPCRDRALSLGVLALGNVGTSEPEGLGDDLARVLEVSINGEDAAGCALQSRPA